MMKNLSEFPLDARVGQLLVKYDGFDYVLGTVIAAWPNGQVEVEFFGEYPYTDVSENLQIAEEYHTWGRTTPPSYY